MAVKELDKKGLIDELFQVGAHFGFVRSRRHPSVLPYIFGEKDKVEIFDLEKTSEELLRVLKFVEEKGREGAQPIIVGGKSEARQAVRKMGQDLGVPFVAGRWIGGTLTNWNEIKKRLQRLEDLSTQKEKGELAKYTKRERLLIDDEIEKLNTYFGGLVGMKSLPKFLIVVDPVHEEIAVAEAKRINIPVVGIAGSDNDLSKITYPIPANDASRTSVAYLLGKLTEAYRKGLTNKEKDDASRIS